MRTIGRRPFLLGSVLAACGGIAKEETPAEEWPTEPALPPPQEVVATPLVPSPSCIDENPRNALSALTGIDPLAPRVTTLYSFTTAEQIAELRAGGPIFSRATNVGGSRGHLFDALERIAREASRPEASLAAELAGKRFELGRFAWPFLAGSRVSPEPYGNEIVAFRVEPDSLFVSFRAGRWPIECFDAAGTAVAIDVAMASLDKIAGFYFLNDTNVQYGTFSRPGFCQYGLAPLLYREFYLANPDKLEEWSLGTTAIVDRLAAEARDLRTLAAELDCTKGRIAPRCEDIVASWTRRGSSRIDGFVASLAFASFFGGAGATNGDLVRLADDLETLKFTPNPLVVAP